MIKKYLHIIVLLVLHILFFAYAYKHQNIYLKDSYEYLNLAENISEHATIYSGDLNQPFNERLVSLRPPAYGAFIVFIRTFSGRDMTICFMQSLISLLSMFMLFKLLNLCYKTYNKWFTLFTLCLFASQYVYCNFIMSEILFQFEIILFIYLHVLYFNNKTKHNLILANAVLAIMVLTKPVAIVVAVFYILFVLYAVHKRIMKMFAMTYVLIPLFVFFGYQYYNYEKTGYYHYSSITSTYLINYQLYKTLKVSYSEQDALKIINGINSDAEREQNLKNYSRKRTQLTLNELSNHKTDFIASTLKGVFSFFIDPGAWDINAFFLNKQAHKSLYIQVYYLFAVFVNLILFLLFLYSISLLKKDPIILLLILIVFAVCIATGLNGSARFRVPVYLPIILLANFSLQNSYIKSFTAKFKAHV